MVEKKIDKRVRRTKRLVCEALVTLMLSKPLEKITTTELCAEADINRNTFYAHYSSPEDVLAEIEQDVIDGMRKTAAKGIEEGNVTLAVCRALGAQRTLCLSIWHGSPRLMQRAVDAVCEEMLSFWQAEGFDDLDYAALYLRFASQGSLGVVQAWLEDGCRQTPEEVAALIDRFVNEGKRGVFASPVQWGRAGGVSSAATGTVGVFV